MEQKKEGTKGEGGGRRVEGEREIGGGDSEITSPHLSHRSIVTDKREAGGRERKVLVVLVAAYLVQ